ncbi:hypothetical protein L204_104898 [Cryptococcus depauperatus]|nr:hypothetical protein L204_05408 [Cryptococcus depauperatus CBS 7855]
MSLFSTLLPFLVLAGIVLAQQPGKFTLKTTTTTSACILLSQLTEAPGVKPVLQAFLPICSNSSPYPSDKTGTVVKWPLSEEGTAAASRLAIYGLLEEDNNYAKAGCVMELSINQVQYLLGRSLDWNPQNLLWDNGGNGFVMNGTSGAALSCGKDSALLSDSLKLPNPFKVKAEDAIWQTLITIESTDISSSAAHSSASSEATTTNGVGSTDTAGAAGSKVSYTGQATPSVKNLAVDTGSLTGSETAGSDSSKTATGSGTSKLTPTTTSDPATTTTVPPVDGGSCQPVTITQIKTVTVGNSRRWWMKEEW